MDLCLLVAQRRIRRVAVAVEVAVAATVAPMMRRLTVSDRRLLTRRQCVHCHRWMYVCTRTKE